ncbi:MAG: SDR family NAD(P)-dependent oxidoreductase [Pedobacter sp.]|nr:SDR family NAD(P)-dependent oxidoreductase [Pedobacter sp.]
MKKPGHIIISGGASGMGLGMARRYLARGCKVGVLDLLLRDEARESLDIAARKGGSSWQFQMADITSVSELNAAVSALVEAAGRPDMAINSAGILINKTVAEMQPEEFHRLINVNLNGSLNFSAAVLPHMRAGSRLALVASLAGHTSNYGYAAYGASKFGVMGLAWALRYEYESLGVHISCICPPEVETPMVTSESQSGNAISLALKKTAGCMQADEACDQIVAGLDAGKWMIIPGVAGKLTAFAMRHMPGIFNWYMQHSISKLMHKLGKPALQ